MKSYKSMFIYKIKTLTLLKFRKITRLKIIFKFIHVFDFVFKQRRSRKKKIKSFDHICRRNFFFVFQMFIQ